MEAIPTYLFWFIAHAICNSLLEALQVLMDVSLLLQQHFGRQYVSRWGFMWSDRATLKMDCRIWKAPKLEVGCYRYLFRRHQFAANSYESTDARTHARVHASLSFSAGVWPGKKFGWVALFLRRPTVQVVAPPQLSAAHSTGTFV